MSTYYQIFGGKINVVASDPANPIKGQVWFNSATPALKYQSVASDAWASGGNMGTGRNSLASSTNGTQTAAAVFGGTVTTTVQSATEEYDGSSWTGGGSLGTARTQLAGAGTQTSALAFCGYDGSSTLQGTEEYNGTSWTAGGNYGTNLRLLRGCGTQTSALGFAGNPIPGAVTTTK